MSLHNIEIFEGLSALDQARLPGRMERNNYPSGSIILRKGDKSDGAYGIQSGKVKIYTKNGKNQKGFWVIFHKVTGLTFFQETILKRLKHPDDV